MELIYSNIDLKNPRDSSLESITVKALVDTGAITPDSPNIPSAVVMHLTGNSTFLPDKQHGESPEFREPLLMSSYRSGDVP